MTTPSGRASAADAATAPVDRRALAVHARFVAHPGRGDELAAAVERMFATAEREPGTLVYAAHRDRDDADAVVMYELYAGDDALDDHGASEAASRFGAELDDLLAEEPQVWFTRPMRAVGIALPQAASGTGDARA